MAQRNQTSAATSEQMEVLLDFLHEHKELARGYMRGPDARERCKRLWASVTLKLNSLGGAVKNSTQWQKVWADKKYTAKKLAALQNRAAIGTGGGPPVCWSLTDAEEKVIEIMGRGFGMPQTSVRTPVILNDENIDPNGQHTEDHDQSIDEEIIHNWGDDTEVIIPDHMYCEPPSEERVAGPSQPALPGCPTTSSQARRVRWRSQRRQLDLRSRLLESERQKLAELAGIREEMRVMTQAITSLLEELKRRN